jgi:hypothetical protein
MAYIPPTGRTYRWNWKRHKRAWMRSTTSAPSRLRRLSQLVVGITNALVDLGMLPIQDIPQLLKSAREVLTAASVILEHL